VSSGGIEQVGYGGSASGGVISAGGVQSVTQSGVAAGITNSALQIGAAISVAAIGSLFFSVLGHGTGERAYAHAFAIAQWTATAGLFLAMLIAIPSRHRRPGISH